MLEKPGGGKLNTGQNFFGCRRPRESKPIYIYVGAARLGETSPINFREIRPRESKPRSKNVWVRKAKGNESFIYVGFVKLSKTSPMG